MVAIGAALGFTHPLLDFFNNLQPLILGATLLSVLLSPVFVRPPRLRALVAAIGATGLLASAAIVVPEAAARLVHSPAAVDSNRPVYKLMTFNLFGLNYDMEGVAAAILLEDPDILFLQEYFVGQRRALHPMLSDAFPFSKLCIGGKRENIAIYANRPFEAETNDACDGSMGGEILRSARITARFNTDEANAFSVMTTHLDWPIQVSKLDDGATISEGLDLASLRQRTQYEDLSEAVNAVDGPLVLGADFNTTPWTYALRSFQQATGLRRETRSLLTFPMRFYIWGWRDTLPLLPLDHVMTKGGVIVHEVRAGDAAGSDHKPVITTFSLNTDFTIAALL